MYLRVAIDAGLIRKMASPMAFRTQVLDIATDQKESVRRSMGLVTNHAPFDLLGEVLINPGSSLLRMAFEAGLIFGIDAGPSKACPFAGPVGAMAIRAFQSPLEHFMGMGKIEL